MSLRIGPGKACEGVTVSIDAGAEREAIYPDLIGVFFEDLSYAADGGLYADLAQTIVDIHPRFVRFPGGCLVHGDGLDTFCGWKDTGIASLLSIGSSSWEEAPPSPRHSVTLSSDVG